MWAKVDDGWWSHPKVLGRSLAARGLWVSALSWSCHQRRDFIPAELLPLFGATTTAEADELVAAGLWLAELGGWRIHDWAEYQEKTLSEKRAEAGRKGGVASGKTRAQTKQTGSNGEASAEAGPSHPIPTHPDLSSSSASAAVVAAVAGGPDEENRITMALQGVAQRRLAEAKGVSRPTAWLATVTRSLVTDEGLDAKAAELIATYPTITDGQLVDVLCGATTVLRFLERREEAG